MIEQAKGDRESVLGSELEQRYWEEGALLTSEPIWKIPATFTSLLGREQETASVRALFQRSDVRLLTLLGTGGIGKTRLAIQVATAMRVHFTDGVCFVSLAMIRDPVLLAPTIAQELGMQETGESGIIEQIKIALQTKNLLLVLDNFEQIIAAAALLTELLAACARLKILVTSRAVLRVQGEYEYPVSPLALPVLKSLPGIDTLAQNAAIALFVQRAQAVQPHFRLASENVAALAEICVRLDGLPLAIELAASRIKLLPPKALLKKLEKRFEVLTRSAHDVPVRQQTLQNTIAWSYDLLDADEQCLFRYLSVFAGGCALDAIEHVVPKADQATSSLLDRVSSLMDKSFLLQNEQKEGEPRIFMLETIREYGRERLRECDEAETAQRRHALYYLKLAEEAGPQLKTARQLFWLAYLEQEQENLRASLEWLIQHNEAELALRFCSSLGWFWHLHGHWSEGRRWLDATLKLTQTGRPTALRARALYSAGDLAYYQDDYTMACALLGEGKALCRELGLQRELANILSTLGTLIHVQGDMAAAHPLLKESETLCRTQGYDWELAYLLRRLGQRALQESDPVRAATTVQQGLLLARKLGDTFLTAITLGTLGDIAAYQGDLPRATTYTQEALSLARELGDKSLTAIALQNLGYIAALQGNLEEAATLARQGYRHFQELGDRMFLTIALHSLGYITARQGYLVQAEVLYQEGIALAQEIGYETQVGLHLIGLAGCAAEQGHYQQAARLLGIAEEKVNAQKLMNPLELADYERLVQHLRAKLHTRDFEVAWSEGRAMHPQQALTVPDHISTQQIDAIKKTSPPATSSHELTAREVTILRLVAQGLTDAQVAEKLVISPRTVSWHLSGIYGKIQVSSRSAATRYALEQHLV